MTREELREKVARALCQEKCAFYGEPPCWGLDPAEYVIEPWSPDKCDEPGCGALADAAIALVLEEAAKVADEEAYHCEETGSPPSDFGNAGRNDAAKTIAAAIRALKG